MNAPRRLLAAARREPKAAAAGFICFAGLITGLILLLGFWQAMLAIVVGGAFVTALTLGSMYLILGPEEFRRAGRPQDSSPSSGNPA